MLSCTVYTLLCRTNQIFQIKNIYYKLELTIYLHNVELTTALAVYYNN